MLVITRKQNESFQISGPATITIVRVAGGRVRVGIDAPRDVAVVRTELLAAPREALPAEAAA